MTPIIYAASLIVVFAGGVLIGYLIREAQHWSEIAKRKSAMRHGSPVR